MRFKRALFFSAVGIWAWLELTEPSRAEDLPSGPPDAVLDLRTSDGALQASAIWRYSDAQLREVDFRAAGPDHKPSGPPNRTHTLEPLAGPADFDDSAWPVLAPTSLEDRHGNGRVSFAWYRLHVAIPERIGNFETAGATVVFETVVDDYAEVWVNGSLPFALQPTGLGQSGGAVIAGWNMPNRRLVSGSATPGERATVAIFAVNGPISDPPANYIWIRRALLAFYKSPHALAPARVDAAIERLDPALDRALARDARVEKVAEGFKFTEGPVWVPRGGGFLLFSDPNRNRIYRYDPSSGGSVSVFRGESGYQGPDVAEYGQPGSNGLALDPRDGALTIDEHGNRRVAKLAADGTETVLAERYRGARLNSPNDLVYRSDGTLYFTDPPFGLPKFDADPRRELPYSGVFKLDANGLELVSQDLSGPNGIAFSPDERFLYVTNWDTAKKVVMRYEVARDGSLSKGRVFFDMGGAPGEEALDGLKVDSLGNLYVSGPGGVWILSPAGAHIGQIVTPELPANFAWGDADRKTLYMTARTGLYRIRVEVSGAGT
ncbi:MAG: SMP-30/gluconolactonase/LRE family protein [Myxococcota bacterium]